MSFRREHGKEEGCSARESDTTYKLNSIPDQWVWWLINSFVKHLLNVHPQSTDTAGFAMASGEGRVSRQSAQCPPQWQSGSTEDSATSLSEERIRARPQPKSKPTPSVESHSSAWKASLWLTRQPHHRLSAPEAAEWSSKLKPLRFLSSSGSDLGIYISGLNSRLRVWTCVISKAWLLYAPPFSKPSPVPLLATE